MGGVEEASTLQTHNTSGFRFLDDPLHFAQFIRSECMTPLALRLPLLNYESYRLSEL
jgi:hypothetical protein